jgi:hypothetical protein
MNVIITLKSVQNGLYKLQIRKETNEIEYKNVEPEKLNDFIQAYEAYFEANGFQFRFIFNGSVKRYCEERLKEIVEQHNIENA